MHHFRCFSTHPAAFPFWQQGRLLQFVYEATSRFSCVTACSLAVWKLTTPRYRNAASSCYRGVRTTPRTGLKPARFTAVTANAQVLFFVSKKNKTWPQYSHIFTEVTPIFQKNTYERTWWSGTRSRIVESAVDVSRLSRFMRNMGYTRFQQRRTGNRRMPRCEEHRKAVCVNSARTVWCGRAGESLFATLPRRKNEGIYTGN